MGEEQRDRPEEPGRDLDDTAPTEPVERVPDADQTRVIPPAGTWAGRAEVPPATPDTAYTGEMPQPRTWWTPVLLGLLALALVGIVVLAAWLLTRDRSPAPAESPAPTATVSPTPTRPSPSPRPSPTASPTPGLVTVPPLVGRTQDDAVTELDRRGLGAVLLYERSSRPEGTVIETRPAAGETVPPGSSVTLIISSGTGPTPTPSATPTGAPD